MVVAQRKLCGCVWIDHLTPYLSSSFVSFVSLVPVTNSSPLRERRDAWQVGLVA